MLAFVALVALVVTTALLEGCGGREGPAAAEARPVRSAPAPVASLAPIASVAPVASVAPYVSPVERAGSEQQRLAKGIQRGWTEAQVLAFAGEPRSRSGDVWAWQFGLADGPRYDVLVTMRAGKVVEVRTAAAACILRE